jgi:type VI protein secretion system component VasK
MDGVTTKPENAKPRRIEGWNRLVARHPGGTSIVVGFGIILMLLAIVAIWYGVWTIFPWWYLGLKGVFGLILVLGLAVVATLALIGFMSSLGKTWSGVAFSAESEALQQAREKARAVEDAVLRELENKDEAGLLHLQRYSRAQLEAYYQMGLQQTRRSFVNATIAMWLGFLILLAGISIYIGPFAGWALKRPPGDFNTIVLASATIVEVIAALFLWVYRSTIAQLTFYYRLQMQSHTSILCYRMADMMEEPDAAIRDIIGHLLKSSLAPERPAATQAKGLRTLLRTDS